MAEAPRALHVAAGNLYGGIERVLVEIAKGRGGWRHEFALCFDGRLSHELDAAGADRHFLGEARFSRPWSIWRARRRLAGLCSSGRYRAIVCHAPWPYALAAPVLDRPPVLWAHDASKGDHWTEQRVARRRPRFVVCNSRYTESAVQSWLPGTPEDVLYYPVSEPVASVSRRDVRRAFGAADDVVIIAMASRFERWKGHTELLRAAAGLKGACEVWIAGIVQRPHERQYEQELRELARELGLSSRVRFLGDRVNVPDLFAAADIHCQPNSGPEPFGVVFIEALYARLPVVTSDAGGAREIVTPECGVLVPMGSLDALTSALQQLAGHPDRRRTLGAAGPARARQLCDPARRVSELESRLEQLAGAPA